jgi:hypothetical protein
MKIKLPKINKSDLKQLTKGDDSDLFTCITFAFLAGSIIDLIINL